MHACGQGVPVLRWSSPVQCFRSWVRTFVRTSRKQSAVWEGDKSPLRGSPEATGCQCRTAMPSPAVYRLYFRPVLRASNVIFVCSAYAGNRSVVLCRALSSVLSRRRGVKECVSVVHRYLSTQVCDRASSLGTVSYVATWRTRVEGRTITIAEQARMGVLFPANSGCVRLNAILLTTTSRPRYAGYVQQRRFRANTRDHKDSKNRNQSGSSSCKSSRSARVLVGRGWTGVSREENDTRCVCPQCAEIDEPQDSRLRSTQIGERRRDWREHRTEGREGNFGTILLCTWIILAGSAKVPAMKRARNASSFPVIATDQHVLLNNLLAIAARAAHRHTSAASPLSCMRLRA